MFSWQPTGRCNMGRWPRNNRFKRFSGNLRSAETGVA